MYPFLYDFESIKTDCFSSHHRMWRYTISLRLQLIWKLCSSVDASVLSKTNTHSTCPWKGEASYYSITLDSKSLSQIFSVVLLILTARQRLSSKMLPGIILSRRRRLRKSRIMLPSVRLLWENCNFKWLTDHRQDYGNCHYRLNALENRMTWAEKKYFNSRKGTVVACS